MCVPVQFGAAQISAVFKRVQLRVVMIAPDSKLFLLPSVYKSVSVMNEEDDCDIIFGSAVRLCTHP